MLHHYRDMTLYRKSLSSVFKARSSSEFPKPHYWLFSSYNETTKQIGAYYYPRCLSMEKHEALLSSCYKNGALYKGSILQIHPTRGLFRALKKTLLSFVFSVLVECVVLEMEALEPAIDPSKQDPAHLGDTKSSLLPITYCFWKVQGSIYIKSLREYSYILKPFSNDIDKDSIGLFSVIHTCSMSQNPCNKPYNLPCPAPHLEDSLFWYLDVRTSIALPRLCLHLLIPRAPPN